MNLSQAIAQLRELNEPVPKPARLPTEQEVRAVEEHLRIRFHPDFRRFLLEASDVTLGALEPVTITDPAAHTDLLGVALDAWKLGVPRDDLLPICEDNGNYYCMNARGEVVFWEHNGTSDERWPDLATWITEVWIGESLDEDEDAEE